MVDSTFTMRIDPEASAADLVHLMRLAKQRRKECSRITVTFVGVDLHQPAEEPELPKLCRLLVDVGLIAFLDESAGDGPGWGAFEVWLCSTGRWDCVELIQDAPATTLAPMVVQFAPAMARAKTTAKLTLSRHKTNA